MGARSRLEKQPTDFRQNICYFGDWTLVLNVRLQKKLDSSAISLLFKDSNDVGDPASGATRLPRPDH
jgi:hypothetical protein